MLNHVENFFRSNFLVVVIVAEFASLHDKMVDFELPCSSFDNFFFNWTLCYESINYHVSLLSNSMSSINSLEIDLRIPIRIKDDYYVSLVEINTNTSSSGWQDKELFITIRVLEIIDSWITLGGWSLSIDTAVLVSSYPQKVIKDIQKSCHLTENEYLALLFKELRNQMIKHFEFHWSIYNMITIDKWRSRLNLVKQVRVIAHLFELHEHIE